ncbi:hypothetical protein [Xanthomonas phage X1]|nr:hypothetical protein [Xanthomonas phage X1]
MKTTELAKQLNKIFKDTEVQKMMKEQYPKIAEYTQADFEKFLKGEVGDAVGAQGRSYQVKQGVCAFGAFFVDRQKASVEQTATYKAVWAVELTDTCPYCSKTHKNKLMFRQPHCSKARCYRAHMIENI